MLNNGKEVVYGMAVFLRSHSERVQYWFFQNAVQGVVTVDPSGGACLVAFRILASKAMICSETILPRCRAYKPAKRSLAKRSFHRAMNTWLQLPVS
jgi:hypothetical protein